MVWRHLALVMLAAASVRALGADHCIILQYHHFSTATPAATSISPERFERQLDHLAAHDHAVVPLERVAAHLAGGLPLPPRCVSITIDDAYESIYREAFPRLRARGWPFTVFVNTDAVDAGGGPYLDWDQLREMAGAGATIANHGSAHDHLIRRRPDEAEAAWRARVRRDITHAAARIRAEVGGAPPLFAYPYGEFDPALQRLVRELGLTAFGQQSGPAGTGSDLAALPRFPMSGPYGALEGFATKVRTLPLPLRRAEPADPVVPLDQWRPELLLYLQAGDYRWGGLRCYANGSPEVDIVWREKSPPVAAVIPGVDLAVGRNRYNCTMPTGEPGVYHWYSHNWFRRHRDGRWYREP